MNKKVSKYLDYEKLISEYPDVKFYMLWSGRGRGKSTNLLNLFNKTSYQNMLLFSVIFRYEKKKAEMNQYFNNKYNLDYLRKITGEEYNHFKLAAGKVYYASYDEKGKEVTGPLAGYYNFLIDQADLKSLQFDDVFYVGFEEFVTDELYLVDEVYKFESLLSTILRERQLDSRCKIFLIGNTLSRVNPYITEWGLLEVLSFNPGDKRVYQFDVNEFKFSILAYMLETVEESQGVAISRKGQQIQKGDWEEKKVNLLNEDFRTYQEHYFFMFSYAGFYFDFRMLSDKEHNYFLFCAKRTRELLDLKNVRTIGDYGRLSNLHTQGFNPLTEKEAQVFNLIKLNKIFFSDRKTGTNFYHAYKQLKQDLKNY